MRPGRFIPSKGKTKQKGLSMEGAINTAEFGQEPIRLPDEFEVM